MLSVSTINSLTLTAIVALRTALSDFVDGLYLESGEASWPTVPFFVNARLTMKSPNSAKLNYSKCLNSKLGIIT